MTAITITIILMGIIAAVCLMIISIQYNQQRKGMSRFLYEFNLLADGYQLTFSHTEMLAGTILGLDAVQRKLLILETKDSKTSASKLVDLSDIKSCSLVNHYGTDRNKNKTSDLRHRYLERIALRIDCHDGSVNEIVFYDHRKNTIMELTTLANKAEHWENSLTRTQEPVQKRA